jgi:hypothetical protein
MPLVVAAGVIASCGGKVVVDGSPDESSGGAGAGGGSTTGTSSTTNSASSVSASTGPSVCQDGGDCGRCFGCATENDCLALAEACFDDGDCEAFQDCTSECQQIGPEECFEKCQSEHPAGASAYLEWIQCSACSVCADSCQVAFSFFCT